MNNVSDEEFVPFLHSLGVDTCKKSFEWMLNDSEFAGVLRWLYDNLDHNNALTAREECRDIKLRGFLRKILDPRDVNDREFGKRYGLNKEAFHILCAELQAKTLLRPSKRVKVEHKILCALSFYRTGSYQRIVGMAKYLGQTTVSKYVTEVTNALNTPAFLNEIIRFPLTRAERDRIKEIFAELEKSGYLLSAEELESTVSSIQNKYQGICLPGDNEGLEDVKLDISMQKERLRLLEGQERMLEDLIRENEIAKDELTIELTRLNSAQEQLAQDEDAAAEECLTLAEEVETVSENVVDIVADTLELYGNCHVNKDIAKKFLTFGPLESYRQTQAMFRSNFDLNVLRKFSSKKNDDFTEEEWKTALAAAKSLEDRLSEGVYAYIESKVQLSGELAKLTFVGNYTNIHPSQFTMHTMETQTALDLLSQEESILEQQLQTAVKDLVTSRTKLAVDATTRVVLAVREQRHADLSHLLETAQQALAVDRVLYCALRHEMRTVVEFVEFASELRQYVASEGDAVASRIDSMNDICGEQDACERRLQSSDVLTRALCDVLGVPHTTDPAQLVRVHNELLAKIQKLNVDIRDRFTKREDALIAFKQSTQPLRKYIWDGCTKQPSCLDRTVAAQTHSLKQEVDQVEKKVTKIGSFFTSVKNGDKQNLRKLWQWFLTDPQRLMAAVKGIHTAGAGSSRD